MASALLASSRDEARWGVHKVYMKNNPKANPNPSPPSNPISHHPNPKKRLRAPSSSPFDLHAAGSTPKADGPPPPQPAAVAPTFSDDSSPFNRRKEYGSGRHLTFNIASYPRTELRELEKRLISELEQVRSLSRRLEERFQSARSTCYTAFAGSDGAGRDVTPPTTGPPALPLDQRPPSDSLVAARSDAPREKGTPKGGHHHRPPEFLTGKDKVASPRISNIHKKLSGSKRPPPTLPAEGAKEPGNAGNDKLLPGMMKKCDQILAKLMKHRFGWVFKSPVDVVGLRLHDYHQIIKHPMDLGTVKSRLKKNSYLSPAEFAADVRLTFNNAVVYNPKGHEVHNMAQQLLSQFENLFGEAYKAYEQEKRAIEKEREKRNSVAYQETRKRAAAAPTQPLPSNVLPTPVPDLSYVLTTPVLAPRVPMPTPVQPAALPLPLPPALGKQPKPKKATDPHKREMSFEEKNKLAESLQDLPQEKMDQVIQIVRRKNPNLALQGDEIELDIEALDAEILWELDRFICNCRKMTSKTRRREAPLVTPPAAADAEDDKHPPVAAVAGETTPEAAAEKKNKGGNAGDEDVDIGEEMPSTHFPPVEIEKDTVVVSHAGGPGSSSSGSSSGSDSSSSSDSDSGSSSGSDSESDDGRSSPAPPSPGN